MGQKGSLTHVWAPVGSRPPVARDNRHGSAYPFGAICPARGVGAAVITPVAVVRPVLETASCGVQAAKGRSAASG